jgi:hypothetical protein
MGLRAVDKNHCVIYEIKDGSKTLNTPSFNIYFIDFQ